MADLFSTSPEKIENLVGAIPIAPIDFADGKARTEHDALVKLVDQILDGKKSSPTADTSALEREIDSRVYRLYGLTKEEIKIVEEGAK